MPDLSRSLQREQAHNFARAALFEACGLSFERQAHLLRKAINKLEKKIDATQTVLVTYQGEYQPVEVEDNPAQLRACEALVDVLGAKPSKQTGESQGDVTINLVFPAACQPDLALDVTPQQVVLTDQSTQENNLSGCKDTEE